ncbi:MAG TPA: spore cortex-lytic enzyme [Thermoanaerobacterales bacterium]|nr:spore cortex-lytic enzyme [Thermoanaerobacterales bacterium]
MFIKGFVSTLVAVLIIAFALTGFGYASTLGSRVLKYDSVGSDVSELQQLLNNSGFNVGYVDGIYGIKTQDAVIKFQQSNGLTIDGIAGSETIRTLTGKNTVSRQLSYSSRDMELLAKLVHAESRGEPYIGQVAVAATVLNRVKSPIYPNTIPGVIFQIESGFHQYCTVRDGQINLTPNMTAKRATQDAVSGVDPTNGAITFYNPRYTTNRWVLSRPYSTTIGNHVFVK